MPISLGNINFGLGVDTSGLQPAMRQIQQFGALVSAWASRSGAGARVVENAMRRQEAATLSALQATLRFTQEARRLQMPVGSINQAQGAFNTLTASMTRGKLSALDYQRTMENFRATMGRLNREMVAFKPDPPGVQMKVWLQDMTSAAVLALGPLSGVGARITALTAIIGRSNIAMAAFAAGAAAAGFAIAKLAQGAIQTELSFGKVEARLRAFNKTNAEARLDFNRLRAIAQNTGIVFTDLANQYTRLQAASAGTSLEGEKTFQIFENISVAAARFQLEGHEVEGVFRALEQIMSKGTVQAEELRNQLGDRLPGAFQAAARAMGVTTGELNKMLKQGQVTAERFLLPFSVEVRKTLGGDSVGAVDSLRASLGRLSTAWQFLQRAFNETTGASEIFKRAVDALARILDTVANNMDKFLAAIAGLAGALAGLALPALISGFIGLAAALGRAAIAVMTLNKSLTVLGFLMGGTAGLFVRAVLAIGGFVVAQRMMTSVLTPASTAQQLLIKDVDEYIKAQEGARTAVRATTQTFIEQVSAQMEAVELQREVLLKFIQTTEAAIRTKGPDPVNALREGMNKLLGTPKTAFGGLFSGLYQQTDQERLEQARKDLTNLGVTMGDFQDRLEKLRRIAALPDAGAASKVIDPVQTDRQIKALREAAQTIDRLKRAMAAMNQGPVAFMQFERLEEINEKVSAFRDRLIDAKISTEVANQAAEQYRQTLLAFREIEEGAFAGAMAAFTAFKDATTEAFNSFSTGFADAIVEGKLNADTFVDIFQSMVKDIIAQMLRLLIVNRILNSLFGGGTPLPVLGFGGSKGGRGATSIVPQGFAAKGLAFGGGVQFMRRGGIMRRPTAFRTSQGIAIGGEAGNEAVMPLTRTAGGRLGVSVAGAGAELGITIIDRRGADAPPIERGGTDRSGNPILIIRAIAREEVGRSLKPAMAAQFGLSPALARK